MHDDDLSPWIYIGDKRELEPAKKLKTAFAFALVCKLQLYFPPMNAKRDKISLTDSHQIAAARTQDQQHYSLQMRWTMHYYSKNIRILSFLF